ncbi:hypothetical protein K400107F7_17620 [Agathobaculum massiliense]
MADGFVDLVAMRNGAPSGHGCRFHCCGIGQATYVYRRQATNRENEPKKQGDMRKAYLPVV